MTFTFKLRRGLSTDWTARNPILSAGEPGVELNTGKLKIGDGVQPWNSLPYFIDEDFIAALVQGLIEDVVLNGVPGKSAYQVAVDNGFVGTVTQWLASLVGPAGTNGTNGTNGTDGAPGISAYQVAVNSGFVGDQSAWLASLIGPSGQDGTDGAPGISAYQVAVNNGFVGNQAAWLASLVGAAGSDGTDGDSAYEVAVNNGFVGTEAQWLASLVGPPGEDGDANIPPVDLTDAPTIVTDASLGKHFRVVLTANRILGQPTNPIDGQSLIWEFVQDATGNRTITLHSSFVNFTGAPIVLPISAGKRAYMGGKYRSASSTWDVLAFAIQP